MCANVKKVKEGVFGGKFSSAQIFHGNVDLASRAEKRGKGAL